MRERWSPASSLSPRRGQQLREGQVAAGLVADLRDVGGKTVARRHQLQRWDQRGLEGRPAAALRETWKAVLVPAVVSYNVGIRARTLLVEMWEAKLKPSVRSYSAGISACARGQEGLRAQALLGEMQEATLGPDIGSFKAGVSLCEQCKRQWAMALL
ncbi:unnamed protein product [Prorocentrum cordatum]|uniref:Uncharacterized protein n=1 Tax=Prorocentrum cordatum TaxID=2364126 RepID=A0ABN9Y6W7_9DINO|nr:unnamed protein product [Polarella glacialis]